MFILQFLWHHEHVLSSCSSLTLLTLPPGTWQIMQDSFRYGSDFDLVVNPSEVWWLELKDGFTDFPLDFWCFSFIHSFSHEHTFSWLSEYYWFLQNLNSISDDTWTKKKLPMSMSMICFWEKQEDIYRPAA